MPGRHALMASRPHAAPGEIVQPQDRLFWLDADSEAAVLRDSPFQLSWATGRELVQPLCQARHNLVHAGVFHAHFKVVHSEVYQDHVAKAAQCEFHAKIIGAFYFLDGDKPSTARFLCALTIASPIASPSSSMSSSMMASYVAVLTIIMRRPLFLFK